MVTACSIQDGAFVAGEPREWSPRRLADTGVLSNFGLDPDGTRIVASLPAAEPADAQSPNHVTFALHFAHEVHRRVRR